jgi:hypothetical protein
VICSHCALQRIQRLPQRGRGRANAADPRHVQRGFDRESQLGTGVVSDFLRGDYPAVLETYAQTRYYPDAATWAALGDASRARLLLKERLDTRQLSPLMNRLMRSLLHLLDARRDEAFAIMQVAQID